MDGREAAGQVAAPGLYLCRIAVGVGGTPTASGSAENAIDCRCLLLFAGSYRALTERPDMSRSSATAAIDERGSLGDPGPSMFGVSPGSSQAPFGLLA